MRYAVHEQGFIDGETYTTEIMQETLERGRQLERARVIRILRKNFNISNLMSIDCKACGKTRELKGDNWIDRNDAITAIEGKK